MSDSYVFSQLREVSQNIMNSIKREFPEETQIFMKEEAKKVNKIAKKIAKKEVGTAKGKKTWVASKSYHRRFKVGKIYQYGGEDLAIRAYNSAPHAHFIEQGHRQVPRGPKGKSNKGGQANGFTDGKMIFYQAETEFAPEFNKDCEEFITNFISGTVAETTKTYGGNIT